jgi:hypothetical protein
MSTPWPWLMWSLPVAYYLHSGFSAREHQLPSPFKQKCLANIFQPFGLGFVWVLRNKKMLLGLLDRLIYKSSDTFHSFSFLLSWFTLKYINIWHANFACRSLDSSEDAKLMLWTSDSWLIRTRTHWIRFCWHVNCVEKKWFHSVQEECKIFLDGNTTRGLWSFIYCKFV